MTIEVLMTTMHQKDLSIADRCRIHSNCTMVNQCDREDYEESVRDYVVVRMFSNRERGASRSRNLSLKMATSDICVLSDDDISYVDGYEEIIRTAYERIPDADVIVFNINSLNPDKRPQEKLFRKIKRVPWYKKYGTVHITFKRERALEKGLSFDTRFGPGSGMYSMGEDTLFFVGIHRAGLRAYYYPAVIADVAAETSTWFKGYNKKYFYDVGALLAASYPTGKHLLKYYYPIRFRKLTKMSAGEIIHLINRGIEGFARGEVYKDQ